MDEPKAAPRGPGRLEAGRGAPAPGPLQIEPIGFIESPHRQKADAPRQPRAAEGTKGIITLLPGRGFEDALEDLGGFSHVWALFWFHQSPGFRPKVLPPRSDRKRGLFATRAPRRPNPIGMSVLRLLRVEGRRVHVEDVDLLDGTPILDLKPYVPWADAIPDARPGWLGPLGAIDARGRPVDPGPSYLVRATEAAEAQLAFLRERGVDPWPRIEAALSLGPQPHAYRRIKPEPGGFRLAVKELRAHFTIAGEEVTVHRISSGYRAAELATRPELELHRAFVARFGR
jgi:tRNA-Thr(GGU) m(6)t(6)A37 methyltransferase TsaA